ncbi:hypothetical protein KC219_27785, partial [Mycobacterium tuberculosis]|nr:hypothetical protein [Mycobacterium tuberculosis]
LASKEIPIHPAPAVLWNFEKFLVGRDGKVVARFAPDVAADDARLREVFDHKRIARDDGVDLFAGFGTRQDPAAFTRQKR